MKRTTLKFTDYSHWDSKRTNKVAEVILKKDIDELAGKINFVSEITKEMKMYVGDTNLPIRKLRALKYNVVTTPAEAEVVLVRKSDVEKKINICNETWYECTRGRWADDPDDTLAVTGGKEIELVECGAYKDDQIEEAEKILDMIEGKVFYDPVDICFGKEELDDVMAIKIEDMMHSNQKDMQNLALRLLMNFNVKRNAYKIASIMDFVPNYRHKDTRFFLDNLETYYPTFTRKDWSFWIRMQIDYPDCPVVARNFNRFLHRHTDVEQTDNFKILKI